MGEVLTLAVTAIWLGILTSISPCPLATNLAAISYVGRDVQRPRRVLAAGLLYALGRSAAYCALGAVLVSSLASAPGLSAWLQKYLNMALGPVLILAGLLLLGWIHTGGTGRGVGAGLQRRVDAMGLAGASVLGVVFALSFCPISAGIFFASLVPLALKQGDALLLPAIYGVGTALPVLAFALLLATGTRRIGGAFARVQTLGLWARRVTGAVFVGVGLYLSLVYVYGL